MSIEREKELRLLSNKIESNTFHFGILYGRRWIEKSFLLKEIISRYDSIYFVAREMSLAYNIKMLSNVIASYFNEPVRFNDIA